MPFTAWKHTERNRQRDRKKYVMISWGFAIPAVQNNSLNNSTPSPWLTRIRFTWISLKHIFKKFPFLT
jgi:hypothetical protein